MLRLPMHTIAGLVCLVLSQTATAEKGRADVLCTRLLEASEGCALNRAFAGLWLGHDLEAANEQLIEAWATAMGEYETLTPEVADAQFKWQLRSWVRLYYLFGPAGSRAPDRLSADNAARIASLFWNYASAKSTRTRADVDYAWFIQGSENHDMMDLGNAFLAVQALADHPDYRDQTLPDGGTPRAHTDAWTRYFTRYCAERIRHGLLIEFASPTYGKYYVPELMNLYDFAADTALRERVGDYLHLIWADWAVEQLHGVRGGAKARCYQGNYSRNGTSDSWYAMGQLLLGTGDWADAARYNHPILGYGPILATSGYTLPAVITALATDPDARGEYVYQSRRPGRMQHLAPLPPLGGHPCWYHMAPEDSRFVRYTWCTPDHILGSYVLDPACREDFNIHENAPDRAGTRYAAITTQNLWQGLIFDTGPDARIFPQCRAKPDKHKPEFSTTYVQQVAVQHENVLLVQANQAHPEITAFRIYFGPGMKARLVARNGWWLLEEGDSYVAVRFFARATGGDVGASWEDAHFLKSDDRYAPAVFVTGRRARFASLDAFAAYLDGHTAQVRDARLVYTFNDTGGNPVSLALWTTEARLPEKNGAPVDLSPSRVFQSPFWHPTETPGTYVLRFKDAEQVFSLNSEGDRP